MNLADFEAQLEATSTEPELEDFCRQNILHGNPFVFLNREADYYKFKKRICSKYEINHTEVFIVGSAKLGFSPLKNTIFSLDSDIDVAIVAPGLWETVFELGLALEYKIRASQVSFHRDQWEKYHSYLRYGAIGWVRPDLIPHKGPMRNFKQEWFDFFTSLSNDNSEVGNYKVSAGLFKSQSHLEKYSIDSLKKTKQQLKVRSAV